MAIQRGPRKARMGQQTLSYRHPALQRKALPWHSWVPALLREGRVLVSRKVKLPQQLGSKPALHWSCCLLSCSGWPRISCYSALVHLHLDSVSSSVPQSSRRIWEYWECSEKGQQDGQALSISSEDRLRAQGLFGEEKTGALQCLQGASWGDGAWLSTVIHGRRARENGHTDTKEVLTRDKQPN